MTALEATGPSIYECAQVQAVYQPIVDLETGEIVAAEALARWPALSVSPLDAFELARADGRVEELDYLCQRAALDGVAGADVPEGFALFVNVEPGSAPGPCSTGRHQGTIVAEITERALLHDPANLLRSLRALKTRGCGVALDDVGAVPETITMLPFVRPDVVKLDVSLVRCRPNIDQARIVTAVAAYAERTGAHVLAEGIEGDADVDRARTLGATLGQGWHFFRPGDLPELRPVRRPLHLLPTARASDSTPSALVDPRRLRTGSKRDLLAISRHIEEQGRSLGSPPVVLAAFQDAAHFTAATAMRYKRLAQRCPLVVTLGADLPPTPATGVRGATLAHDDPLRGEWVVAVVGSHYTGALIASDLGDSGPEAERRFRFAVTHDHETVLQAARALLARVEPIAM